MTQFFLSYGCRGSGKTVTTCELYALALRKGLDASILLADRDVFKYGDYSHIDLIEMSSLLWDINGNYEYVFCDFHWLNSIVLPMSGVNQRSLLQAFNRFSVITVFNHYYGSEKIKLEHNQIWLEYASKNELKIITPEQLKADIKGGYFV